MKFRVIASILIVALCVAAYLWSQQGGTTADAASPDSGSSYSLD